MLFGSLLTLFGLAFFITGVDLLANGSYKSDISANIITEIFFFLIILAGLIVILKSLGKRLLPGAGRRPKTALAKAFPDREITFNQRRSEAADETARLRPLESGPQENGEPSGRPLPPSDQNPSGEQVPSSLYTPPFQSIHGLSKALTTLLFTEIAFLGFAVLVILASLILAWNGLDLKVSGAQKDILI